MWKHLPLMAQLERNFWADEFP